MKPDEINPHEILEIAPGATRSEIERAYYLARLAYGSDSLASYSLYSSGERTEILDRIDRAYRLLVGEPATVRSGAPEGPAREEAAAAPAARGGVTAVPVARDGGEAEAGNAIAPEARPPARSRERLRPIPARPPIEATEVPRPYDAEALRRVRESRGLSLEEIVAQTRISLKNLRLIESGDYGHLPPIVYLRGYVTQYAKCLRLSPTEVLADYLEAVGGATAGKGGKLGKHE